MKKYPWWAPTTLRVYRIVVKKLCWDIMMRVYRVYWMKACVENHGGCFWGKFRFLEFYESKQGKFSCQQVGKKHSRGNHLWNHRYDIDSHPIISRYLEKQKKNSNLQIYCDLWHEHDRKTHGVRDLPNNNKPWNPPPFLTSISKPLPKEWKNTPTVSPRFEKPFQPYHMGVSKNNATPKWMVKIMENPMNKWMNWGVFPYFWFNTHINFSHNRTSSAWVWHGATQSTAWATKATLDQVFFFGSSQELVSAASS